MNSLISMNMKFMEISPKELVETILKYKHTKGIEICIDYNNQEELSFLDKLVYEVKNNNLLFQIHANVELEYSKQVEYMKLIESYSDLLGYPIVVTFHTITDPDEEVSITKTVEYLGNLVNEIDNDKIVVCLENLNEKRLDKQKIHDMILNDEKIYFTYDIGHELGDYGNLTDLDEYMIEDIRNIHLHTHKEDGTDHQPIYKNDKYWNDIMKSLIFLINNNYRAGIVYEYDLYECRGESLREKFNDYLESIDFVSEKYINL